MGWKTQGVPNLLGELGPRLEAARREGVPGLEHLQTRSFPIVLKYEPLRGSAARRYGARDLLGLRTPRLAEFGNLTWLRSMGFGAPRPLAAGLYREGARALFQFLATEQVQGAATLRATLQTDEPRGSAPRRAVLESLGREVSRLHSAGFVHRDLFPRNLLLTRSADPTEFYFLDAWRGGPGPAPPGRGRTFDLACLALYLPDLTDPEEDEVLFGAYFRAGGREISPAKRRATMRAVVRIRHGLLAHLRRRGRTSPPIPTRDWSPPFLDAR